MTFVLLSVVVLSILTLWLFGRNVKMSVPKGIRLDLGHPFWEVSGNTNFSSFLMASLDLLPGECALYLEGGSPTGKLLDFLREHEIPERAHVACGTIWPKPRVFHLPVTPEIMRELADLMHSHVYPELAIHVHAYRDQTVLLEWHDAFTQPMLLSGEFEEGQVVTFARLLKMSYQRGSAA